jgi:dihydrofolate reductase
MTRSAVTLDRVDWNAEVVRGDLGKAVQQLKRESGKGLFVGGVKLPLALAEQGLIDEYEFVVHPRLAGHGPTLFAGPRAASGHLTFSRPTVLGSVSCWSSSASLPPVWTRRYVALVDKIGSNSRSLKGSFNRAQC